MEGTEVGVKWVWGGNSQILRKHQDYQKMLCRWMVRMSWLTWIDPYVCSPNLCLDRFDTKHHRMAGNSFFLNLTLFEPFWNKKKHLHHPKINPQTKKCWWSVKKYILLIIILISIEMPWKSTLLPSQGPRSPPPKNITKAGPHSIFLIAILISSNKLKILKIPLEMCHLLRKVWNATYTPCGSISSRLPESPLEQPPKKVVYF